MSESTVVVRPLSAERLAEFLAFFDGPAFTESPHWAPCCCQCCHEDHSKVVWKDRTGAQNRVRACERIANGEMQGYLASAGGEPVGWFSAGPRRLSHALDAACDGLRAQGLTIAEADPRPNATSAADNHFGPLRLYLAAGFDVHRTDTDGSVCVRKAL